MNSCSRRGKVPDSSDALCLAVSFASVVPSIEIATVSHSKVFACATLCDRFGYAVSRVCLLINIRDTSDPMAPILMLHPFVAIHSWGVRISLPQEWSFVGGLPSVGTRRSSGPAPPLDHTSARVRVPGGCPRLSPSQGMMAQYLSLYIYTCTVCECLCLHMCLVMDE